MEYALLILFLFLLLLVNYFSYKRNCYWEKFIKYILRDEEEKYRVIIDKTVNGYICTYKEDGRKEEYVIEELDIEHGELHAANDLLWYVKNYFGVYWNKNKEVNLDISIVGSEEEEEEGTAPNAQETQEISEAS